LRKQPAFVTSSGIALPINYGIFASQIIIRDKKHLWHSRHNYRILNYR